MKPSSFNNLANQYITEQHIIKEGRLDRLGAQIASIAGATKGLGQQIKGRTQQAIGKIQQGAANVAGKVAGVNPQRGNTYKAGKQRIAAGTKQIAQGKTVGKIAGINQYKQIANKKINALTQDIFNDLQKLGYNVQGVSPESVNAFTLILNNAIDALIQDIQSGKA